MRRDSRGVLLIGGDVSQTIIGEAGPRTDPTVTREAPMDPCPLPPPLADFDPVQFAQSPQGVALGIILVVFGLVLIVAIASFSRRRKRRPRPAPETIPSEDLSSVPPPPGKPGARRLTVRGVPARLRLVVFAPLGRGAVVDPDQAELLLDQVLFGLGEVVKQDKPLVRVWATQLSAQGFTPTFQRLVSRPEPAGAPSRWLLLSGPVRVGSRQVLLGLALLADQAVTLDPFAVEAHQWYDVLRLQERGG
jgi:hypothetical protein